MSVNRHSEGKTKGIKLANSNLLDLVVHASGIINGGSETIIANNNILSFTRGATGVYQIDWGTEIGYEQAVFVAQPIAQPGVVIRAVEEIVPGQPPITTRIGVLAFDMAGLAADFTFEFAMIRLTLP